MRNLWRAADEEGEILESYITKMRDKAAARLQARVHSLSGESPGLNDRRSAQTCMPLHHRSPASIALEAYGDTNRPKAIDSEAESEIGCILMIN